MGNRADLVLMQVELYCMIWNVANLRRFYVIQVGVLHVQFDLWVWSSGERPRLEIYI